MAVLALGRPKGDMVWTGQGLCSTVFLASLGVVPEIGEDTADEMSIGTGVPSLLRCTSVCSASPALHLTFYRAKYGLARYNNVPEAVVERPLLITAYHCEFRHTTTKVMSGAGGLSRRACGQDCLVEFAGRPQARLHRLHSWFGSPVEQGAVAPVLVHSLPSTRVQVFTIR